MPNHYAGDLLRTMAMYGLSRVRTELFKLTVPGVLSRHQTQPGGKLPPVPKNMTIADGGHNRNRVVTQALGGSETSHGFSLPRVKTRLPMTVSGS